MKIKYFSQLCEQLHVNQFLHNFKENEQIFDQLKLNSLFKENEQFSVVLSSGHQNEHFQEIACSRLVSLHQILWILRKMTYFKENEHISMK